MKNNKNCNNKTFLSSILAIFSLLVSKVVANKVRPHITAIVNGNSERFLWDTGAGCSIMNVKDFRKIPIEKRPPKLPHFQKLVSASGDAIHVTGVYNLKYQIGTRTVYQPTFVCTNSDNILGIDAIGNLQITWVESRNKFVYDEIFDSPSAQKKICFQEDIDPSNFATEISTVAKITIPPLTHVVVPLVITPKKCYTPPPGVSGIAHIFSVDFPLVTNSPGLVTIDSAGKVFVSCAMLAPPQ